MVKYKKAEVADIPTGNGQIVRGFLTEEGTGYVSALQVASLFHLGKQQVSRDLARAVGRDNPVRVQKLRTDFNNKAINAYSLGAYKNIVLALAVKGNAIAISEANRLYGVRTLKTAVRSKRKPTFLYLIGWEDSPYVKIGIARDPKSRLKGLQTASPFKLKIELTALVGHQAKSVEDGLHKNLFAYKAEGEWFERSPAILAFNSYVLNRHKKA